MSKLIINNNTELSDVAVMKYIEFVLKKGKISKPKNGEQYCFATIFADGISVTCNKSKEETYTFRIKKEVGNE